LSIGEVLAVRAVAGLIVQVRHPRRAGSRSRPRSKPERGATFKHLLLHLGVVVVQDRAGERRKRCPVVLAGGTGVPGPVRRLGVEEDDPRLAPSGCRRRTRRNQVAVGAGRSCGLSWNQGSTTNVWVMTRSAINAQPRADAPVDEGNLKSSIVPVVGVDRIRVGRVRKAAVFRGSGWDRRQEPDAVERSPAGSRGACRRRPTGSRPRPSSFRRRITPRRWIS